MNSSTDTFCTALANLLAAPGASRGVRWAKDDEGGVCGVEIYDPSAFSEACGKSRDAWVRRFRERGFTGSKGKRRPLVYRHDGCTGEEALRLLRKKTEGGGDLQVYGVDFTPSTFLRDRAADGLGWPTSPRKRLRTLSFEDATSADRSELMKRLWEEGRI